jgi:ATP/ADP translocase
MAREWNPPQGATAPVKKAPWFPVDGAEARICITGFLLLFCVLGGYFAVRPVRETIGTMIGREATQNLWFFTALFAIIIVPFYGWLVARVRRSVLLPSIYGFMRWHSWHRTDLRSGALDPWWRGFSTWPSAS